MKFDFTRDSVAVMLQKLSGNTFIGLTTKTTVKLTGGMKNPQQGRVTKITESSVQVFQGTNGYANKVNRRLEAEGKDPFVVGPRPWGERIDGTPFVTNKGNDYLEVIFNKVISSQLFLDGKPVDADAIEGLPAKREGKQGDLEDKVVIRTYALSSIRELRAFGEEFAPE